jgi:hypothetical protein
MLGAAKEALSIKEAVEQFYGSLVKVKPSAKVITIETSIETSRVNN